MHDFSTFKRSAIRYWEWRRLYYNVALVFPTLFGYPLGVTAAEREGLVRESGAVVVVLLFALWAVPANICYTSAYSLEFLFGNDSPEARWTRFGRTLVFLSGTFFAMVLAYSGGAGVAEMVFRHKL
jgi:hypothetical protein